MAEQTFVVLRHREIPDIDQLDVYIKQGGFEAYKQAVTKMTPMEVVDVVNQIAAASEEQSTTSEDISRSVESISTVSSEAAMGISHISQTANKLRRETDALRQLVSQFKMANGGAVSPPLPPREDRAPEPRAVAAPTPSDSIWT